MKWKHRSFVETSIEAPPGSHQGPLIKRRSMERKYEKNKRLSLIIKIKRAEKVLAAMLPDDRTAFEESLPLGECRTCKDTLNHCIRTDTYRAKCFWLKEPTAPKHLMTKIKVSYSINFSLATSRHAENFPLKQTTIPQRNSTFLDLAKEKLKKSSNPWMQRKPAVPTTSAISSFIFQTSLNKGIFPTQ